MPTAKEFSMKRLAASLMFAAILLVPAVSFAQKPTTRVIPCNAACKHQQCTDKGAEHAKMVCNDAKAANKYACVERQQRKYISQCMRAPFGED
jgi:hypothetical protein